MYLCSYNALSVDHPLGPSEHATCPVYTYFKNNDIDKNLSGIIWLLPWRRGQHHESSSWWKEDQETDCLVDLRHVAHHYITD